jgi:hypothetical protein
MVDMSDAATAATVNGIAAVVVAALGVEPQALVWAMVGSTLGLSLAKPAGRVRAVFVFIAASLTCALLGTLAANHWFTGSPTIRNVAAVALGAAFHPLLSSYLEEIPRLFLAFRDFIMRRGTSGGGK